MDNTDTDSTETVGQALTRLGYELVAPLPDGWTEDDGYFGIEEHSDHIRIFLQPGFYVTAK